MSVSKTGAPDTPSPEPGAPSLSAALSRAWAQWRNKLFMSERFQRFAVRFPLTQETSNSYAQRLFDMAVGFSYARVLHACVRLDLFSMIRDNPASAEALAKDLAMPLAGMLTLLRAAASLALIEDDGDGRWRLGPLGAALLGNPGVEAMIAHHALLYEDLLDPVALLRGEITAPKVASFWPYAANDPAAAAAYSELMAKTQAMIARQVTAAYAFRRHRMVMDVGGGEGVFLCHVAAAASRVRVRLVDLPPVAARAEARFARAGLSQRAETFGLDARRDPLPTGADAITLVRVLHDHDDDDAFALLCAARASLPPGGVLLIAEPMAGAKGAAPMGHAYFGLYLTAMGQGRPRTAEELKVMLHKAGFRSVRERHTAQRVLVRLLVARV